YLHTNDPLFVVVTSSDSRVDVGYIASVSSKNVISLSSGSYDGDDGVEFKRAQALIYVLNFSSFTLTSDNTFKLRLRNFLHTKFDYVMTRH
ncbi:27788_t:CDS:2, partial [Dentiscutata erythropus]